MMCPGCRAELGTFDKTGKPMVRGRGMMLRADGPAMVCPKCKGAVPLSTEFAKALQHNLVLLFARPKEAPR